MSVHTPALPERRGALLLVLAMLTAFAPFATDMYLPAFGQMAEAFSTDTANIEATLSTFFLGLALGQAIYGPLIDRFGRKLPLFVGVALFAIATLGCLLTRDIHVLLGLRLLQALGGCAGMIIGRAIINDLYGHTESARVLSLMMMIATIAPITAPMIGGWILGWGNWVNIFMLVQAYSILCLVLVWRVVPETHPAARRSTRLNAKVVASAYGALLKRPAFIIPAVAGALVQSSMFAFITGSPFIFMGRFGLTGQEFGWLFGLTAFGIAIGAQINRMGLKRVPVTTMLGRAMLWNLVAALVLVALAGTTTLAALAIPLWCLIASLGLIGGNAAATAMAASGQHAGSGSGLIGVLQFGFAFIVSSVVAANQNGTAYPMTIAMLTVSSLGTALWFGTHKLRARSAQALATQKAADSNLSR